MQTNQRIQFWPHFPVVLAAALTTELVRGVVFFLGLGQIYVNGQPIDKLTYLSQHLAGLARGVTLFGVPFGVVAWIVPWCCSNISLRTMRNM